MEVVFLDYLTGNIGLSNNSVEDVKIFSYAFPFPKGDVDGNCAELFSWAFKACRIFLRRQTTLANPASTVLARASHVGHRVKPHQPFLLDHIKDWRRIHGIGSPSTTLHTRNPFSSDSFSL